MDVPCVVKWIGSKRIQSGEIVQYFPNFINTYYEEWNVTYMNDTTKKLYYKNVNGVKTDITFNFENTKREAIDSIKSVNALYGYTPKFLEIYA